MMCSGKPIIYFNVELTSYAQALGSQSILALILMIFGAMYWLGSGSGSRS